MSPHDLAEFRAAALNMALGYLPNLRRGDDIRDRTMELMSLAVVFATFITEDIMEAKKVLMNEPDKADVVQLRTVPKP